MKLQIYKALILCRLFLWLLLVMVLLINCRGEISDKPPVHLNPNMDFQPKEKPQDIVRSIPEGTVAFGYERDVNAGKPQGKFINQDQSFYTGKSRNGEFLNRIPMHVNRELLLRGQERFNIYCAACHDRAGTSKSVVVKRGVGIPPPPDLAAENLVVMPDGQIFFNVKNGIRNMPGYGIQLEANDLWAVVAYVRAIQVSRNASADQVPAKIRTSLINPSQ